MKIATLNFAGQTFRRCYIEDAAEASKVTLKLANSKAKRFGLDIETGKGSSYEPVMRGKRIIGPAPGLCPHLSFIRLIQIYDPTTKIAYVFDVWKMRVKEEFNYRAAGTFHILFKEKKFIAHNGVFELKHLSHNGFHDIHVDCSMLLSILVDRAEHSPFESDEADDRDDEDGEATSFKKKGYGLDAVIGRLFKIRIAKHEQTSDWNREKLSKSQINYAALDALLTYKVGVRMMKKVAKYKMEKAYEVLRDMQHVVADMELRGLAIDWKAHRKLMREWKDKHEHFAHRCSREFGEVNLRSSKQLNEWVRTNYPEKFWKRYWPLTKTSLERLEENPKAEVAVSFGKDSLKQVIDVLERKFKRPTRALSALLEYKKYDKLLSTYGETLIAIQHPITKRLHSSFIIGETRTGRLSCREPNLQNLPRDKSVRALFTAPANRTLLVADYSQIEMRAEGALSDDVVMQTAFKKDIDLHERIVKVCLGIDCSKITDPEERKMARFGGKAINFGFSFGMGGPKFERYALTQYGVKIPEGGGKRIQQIYQKTYPGYYRYCEEQRRICAKLGYVVTPLGRRRKLEEGEQYTKSVNTPVQGGAAEAIMVALIRLRERLPDNCHIVSTVHDEILIECPKPEPRLKILLEECMTYGFSKVFPNGVTNKLVDAHFGKSWAAAK